MAKVNSSILKNGVRIGIRAHDLGCLCPDDLAQMISGMGFHAVQLALGKAIKGADLGAGLLSQSLVSETAQAFSARQVRIEVLGCYINPIHPDPHHRRGLIGLFKEHLRHARSFGCGIVALESGSLHPDYSPHPENSGEVAFKDLLGTMRELVDEAERCGVVVGIEAVTSHVISTPERMRRLLDEIASPYLKVVFDPVNLLNEMNAEWQHDVVRSSLFLFGDEIAVLHAKDFRIEGGHLMTCPAGTGMLDYQAFVPWILRNKPNIAFVLEEADVGHAGDCRSFVLKQLSGSTS